MQNDLKREKESVESFNKTNEAIKYFEKLLKSPRSNNDTYRLGYTSIEEGESSKMLKKGIKKVRNPNPLVIIVVRKDILLMCVGARMEMNMSNLRTWVTIKNAISKVARHKNA